MTIKIRPHHLLCLLTYAGEGYNDAFIDNFNKIVHRLKLGEDVLTCFWARRHMCTAS